MILLFLEKDVVSEVYLEILDTERDPKLVAAAAKGLFRIKPVHPAAMLVIMGMVHALDTSTRLQAQHDAALFLHELEFDNLEYYQALVRTLNREGDARIRCLVAETIVRNDPLIRAIAKPFVISLRDPRVDANVRACGANALINRYINSKFAISRTYPDQKVFFERALRQFLRGIEFESSPKVKDRGAAALRVLDVKDEAHLNSAVRLLQDQLPPEAKDDLTAMLSSSIRPEDNAIRRIVEGFVRRDLAQARTLGDYYAALHKLRALPQVVPRNQVWPEREPRYRLRTEIHSKVPLIKDQE